MIKINKSNKYQWEYMNNITSKLLEELKNYKLPNLKLADEFIHPNYEGQSILNVPSSVCK